MICEAACSYMSINAGTLVLLVNQSSSDVHIYLPPEVFQRDQSNQRVKFIYFKVCWLKIVHSIDVVKKSANTHGSNISNVNI